MSSTELDIAHPLRVATHIDTESRHKEGQDVVNVNELAIGNGQSNHVLSCILRPISIF